MVTNLEIFFIQLIIFAFLLAIASYLHLKKCLTYWKNKQILPPNISLFLGNETSLMFQKAGVGTVFRRIYESCRKELKPYCGLYFITRPILVIVDLDIIKKILSTDFQHFTDRVYHSNEYDPMSMHLAALKGLKWKELRTKLSPAFSPAKLRMMFPIIAKCSDPLLSIIDGFAADNKPMIISKIIERYAIDSIVTCAFGIEGDTQKNPNSKFAECGAKFFNCSMKDTVIRLLMYTYPELLDKVKVNSVNKEIGKFFVSTVEQVIKHREASNLIRPDFIHFLLQIRNNNKVAENEVGTIRKGTKYYLSIKDIAAQCMIFFVAGYETTSSLISYCLYELAKYENYQNRARAEVRELLAANNNTFTYDLIMELEFLERCLKETLRKYTPIPLLVRECTEPYTLPRTNITIDKGTAVVIPVVGIHNDPEYYDNPNMFDPDRFAENYNENKNQCKFLPCGFGPRNCIAFQFGILQAKLVMARLLTNYTFSLNAKTEEPLKINEFAFISAPLNGVWMNVEKL